MMNNLRTIVWKLGRLPQLWVHLLPLKRDTTIFRFDDFFIESKQVLSDDTCWRCEQLIQTIIRVKHLMKTMYDEGNEDKIKIIVHCVVLATMRMGSASAVTSPTVVPW